MSKSSTTPKPRAPRSAHDVWVNTLAEMLRLVDSRRVVDGPRLHQLVRPFVLEQLDGFAGVREAVFAAENGDEGWTVARAGEMNPWLWCALELLEELADVRSYGGRFLDRMEPRRGTAARVRELRASFDLHLAELTIITSRLAALQAPGRGGYPLERSHEA